MDTASECGFGSVAAVPLHYQGTVYGVLLLQTVRERAFTPRERDGFDVLGRTVGFIINAVRNQKRLFAESVVELEFRVPADDSVVGRVATMLGSEIELAGSVATEDQWLLYIDVDCKPRPDQVESIRALPGVEQARVLRASSGGGQIEVAVSAPSLLHGMTHAGGSVKTATADPAGSRFVIEAPVDIEARDIVEHLQHEQPTAELLAHRTRDRPLRTVGHPEGVLEKITSRQREVLEAAYRAGYYAWPRDSTANEVAASLDLTSATLHGHLRKAEEVILSTLFEGE